MLAFWLGSYPRRFMIKRILFFKDFNKNQGWDRPQNAVADKMLFKPASSKQKPPMVALFFGCGVGKV